MLDTRSGMPLQVEVNTVSTSFMGLGSKVTLLHQHLAEYTKGNIDDDMKLKKENMPTNDSLNQAAKTLCEGWKCMECENASILMVVQEGNEHIRSKIDISESIRNNRGEDDS